MKYVITTEKKRKVVTVGAVTDSKKKGIDDPDMESKIRTLVSKNMLKGYGGYNIRFGKLTPSGLRSYVGVVYVNLGFTTKKLTYFVRKSVF